MSGGAPEETGPTLEDTGFSPETTDPISRTRAVVLAACLDADPGRLDVGTLPPLWHWACFVPTVPTAALGPDGHPRRRQRRVDGEAQRRRRGEQRADARVIDLTEHRVRR